MSRILFNIFLLVLVFLSVSGCDVGHNNFPGPREPQYTSIEAAVGDSLGAYELYLSDVGDSLSPAIGKLKRLRILTIRGAHLRLLPEEFRQLVSLEYLTLDNAGFTRIPPQVFSLVSLKSFQFTNHRLDSIPEGLATLHLESLDLSQNSLNTIPEWLQEKESLQRLSLNQNNFRTFTVEQGAFPDLSHLELDQNALVEFHSAPGAFPKLKTLFLNENSLELPPPAIDSLPIDWLQLNRNRIGSVPLWLQRKRSLLTLELTSNEFQEFLVEKNAFPSVKYLFLDRNQLKDLPRPSGAYANLATVLLYGNPISDATIAQIRARFPRVTVKF